MCRLLWLTVVFDQCSFPNPSDKIFSCLFSVPQLYDWCTRTALDDELSETVEDGGHNVSLRGAQIKSIRVPDDTIKELCHVSNIQYDQNTHYHCCSSNAVMVERGGRNSHQHRYTLCQSSVKVTPDSRVAIIEDILHFNDKYFALCEELRVYQGDRHQSPMARHYFLRYFRSHRKELLNIADLSRPLAHYISTRNNAYFILNKEYVWILRYHVLHVTCVPLLCFIRDTFLAT